MRNFCFDFAPEIFYYRNPMNKQALQSSFIWIGSTLITVLLYFVMLFFVIVTYPFDNKKRRLVHAQCFWWSNAVISLNPYWKVHVCGLENIDHKKTYVIVANHQSLADIAVMYQTRMQFKWVAKEDLFKIPFLGWELSLAKHIRLERGDFSSIKKVYRQAAEWLRCGMSVLFFPEGTRSETGDMKDFQNGAFKLAIKEKVPVLPIYLYGTGNAIPKGGRIFTATAECGLKVLPAVDTAQFQAGDFAKLRDLVRGQLEKASRG
jgi:1-acyl-sn-glycerol-3-phosphate acyltransferase